MSEKESVTIDRNRAALIIQDMQNDVMMEGGAFADSGAPAHAKEQNAVENCRRLAEACRGAGIPVIHVWSSRASRKPMRSSGAAGAPSRPTASSPRMATSSSRRCE